MTKEEFLSIAEGYYTEIEGLNEAPTFYDYEKSLEKIMQKMTCACMSNQLNGGTVKKVTKNRRKKKTENSLRRYNSIKVSQVYAGS